jgi:hypothetical protein
LGHHVYKINIFFYFWRPCSHFSHAAFESRELCLLTAYLMGVAELLAGEPAPTLTWIFPLLGKWKYPYHQESRLGKIHVYIRALTSAKQCSNWMTRHENLQTCHGHTSSTLEGAVTLSQASRLSLV